MFLVVLGVNIRTFGLIIESRASIFLRSYLYKQIRAKAFTEMDMFFFFFMIGNWQQPERLVRHVYRDVYVLLLTYC